jgi:putative ABC transport system permease protein
LLLRSSLRFLRSAPGSTLSVFFGVAIGVLSITGVHLLGESVGRTFDTMRPPHLGTITHVLTRKNMNSQDYGQLRARWRSGEWPSIAVMLPLREGVLDNGVRVVGIDWIAAMEARLPMAPQVAGVNVSDRVSAAVPVIVEGEWPEGLIDVDGIQMQVVDRLPGRPEQSRALYVDIGTATQLLGDDKRLDAVLVRHESVAASSAALLESIMPGISAGLPATSAPVVKGWQVHAVDGEAPGQGLAKAVLFNLGALGSLSLLVSLLLMYQTAVIWLRRQKVILAALHDLGVDRWLLGTSFVTALLCLGIPATALGVIAGDGLAGLLLTSAFGGAMSVVMPELGAAVVIKAVVAGMGVCIVGGGLAWWREWREHPISAVWVRLSVAGMIMLSVLGLTLPDAGLIGVFVSILCICLLAGFSVSPLLRGWRRRANRMGGPLWLRLGVREVTWYPDDLAIACAALALAVAVSIGVGVMVDSFRREFSGLLDQRLVNDVYVSMSSGSGARELASTIQTWPETGRVMISGQSASRVGGLPVQVGYTKFSAEESLRYGHSSALAKGEALVSETLVRTLDLAVGQSVQLDHEAGGESTGQVLNIVGLFKGYGELGFRILVDTDTAKTLFAGPLTFDRLSIDTAQPLLVLSRLGKLRGVRVTSGEVMRNNALQTFNRTFAITDALTWLALLVSSAAMFNALTGFRLSQQTTGRLLDTQGVDFGWNLRTSMVRAGMLGLIAAGIALPLGLWLGWVLCEYVNPRAFGWTIGYSPTLQPLMLPLLLTGLATVAAGLAGAVVRPPFRPRR